MSSRLYPMHQMGNPQLRIFLPNFWMKLVKPAEKQPPNVVQFKVPLAMTNHDIRNYLEKIYGVRVMHVASELEDGRIKRGWPHGPLTKEDDFRRAFVTISREDHFEFPELETEQQKHKESKRREDHELAMQNSFKKYARQGAGRRGVPQWFSI